jgi:hypothetical protein
MEGTGLEDLLGPKGPDAGELLGAVERVSKEARRARHGYWFPLLLFGLTILGALPFYYYSIGHYRGEVVNLGGGITGQVVNGGGAGFLDRFGLSGFPGQHPWGAAVYWLIAVPSAYVLVAFYYVVRARRTGLRGRIWPYLVAGLVLFALLLATAPGILLLFHAPEWMVSWQNQIGDLYIRGLTPVLVISLSFFVLARLERSKALLWIAIAFIPVALLANLYNISNAFYRIWTPYKPHHWIVPDWAANLAVAGGFLVFVGLVSGLVARRRSS